VPGGVRQTAIEREAVHANGAPVTDGRRLRRHHNREAVIDALPGLFDNGIYRPSAAEIAERAGLSPRSLFRYVDDAGAERAMVAALRVLFDEGGPR
jgi:AcrR family transcriptional regulator